MNSIRSKQITELINANLNENHSDIKYYFYYLDKVFSHPKVVMQVTDSDYENIIDQVLNYAYQCAMTDNILTSEERIELEKIYNLRANKNLPLMFNEVIKNISKFSNKINSSNQDLNKEYENRYKKSPFYIDLKLTPYK